MNPLLAILTLSSNVDSQAILCGILSGIITALFGYFKSATEETFNLGKFVQTIIIGAIVGGVAGYYGVDYQQAYDWLASIGAITAIEYVKKGLWRLIKKFWDIIKMRILRW